jgi:L-ascorbate metabolism protein UlaG (beta-lactamase superfamily)
MKTLITLLLFSSILVAQEPSGINITYVANDGFLISANGTTILIDALFKNGFGRYDVPSEQLRNAVTSGSGAFKKIDLYLVTHKHADHFYAPYVANFLKHHEECQLVSNSQVVGSLSSDSGLTRQLRLIVCDTSAEVDTIFGGVILRIFRTRHIGDSSGTNPMHFAFLVKMVNMTIFHTGDGDLGFNADIFRRHHLEQERIDVVLTGNVLDEPNKEFLTKVIRPKHIIYMHNPPSEVSSRSRETRSIFPNAFLFSQPLESNDFK